MYTNIFSHLVKKAKTALIVRNPVQPGSHNCLNSSLQIHGFASLSFDKFANKQLYWAFQGF